MPKPVVLYVEDEEDDVLLMKLAFEKAGLGQALQSVGDGIDAMKYLAGENSYADRQRHPLPSLVLLDLNLPVKSGFEVLDWMRGRPELRQIPVVVFSSSDIPEDKARARDLGARDFIEKPSGGKDAFGRVVRSLSDKWIG